MFNNNVQFVNLKKCSNLHMYVTPNTNHII